MWPTSKKTIALLAQKQAGDEDAWNQLLDRHRKSLHRMVQLRLDRRIRQRVDVSDVLQDVLIEANRRIDRYLDNPIMDFHLWIRQIAKDRIIDAHRRGVLHRDLKPSNIMVDEDGKTHVTDFGLAKRFTHDQDITQTGAILGTPAYMAPEQASGDRGSTGVHTDIYALGAILYFMVLGRPPFSAATPMDTVLLVLGQEVTPPRVLNARIDRDLEMIILKCLQKPVDLRYRSAQQLTDDLRAYLNNQPVSANKGRLSNIIAGWFSETPHAVVLQNWGMLWMWHSVVLLIACIVTNIIFLNEFDNRLYYSMTWTLGLGTWAIVFWKIRHLRGSVLFVERQIAHAWAASMLAIALLFPVESLLGIETLQTAPVLGLISGMVFLFKAGILTGKFYLQAAALFTTSLVMAAYPKYALTLFGCISALCFFIPGWHYHRRKN